MKCRADVPRILYPVCQSGCQQIGHSGTVQKVPDGFAGFSEFAAGMLHKLLIVVMAISLPVAAQTIAPPMAPRLPDGVAGLIVNVTMTANGQEFYRNFTEFWRDKPDGENYTLAIEERPSRRLGNQISVVYGQKQIFLSALPLKFELVRALSEQAADASYANIITLGMFAPSSRDPDLGVDEL